MPLPSASLRFARSYRRPIVILVQLALVVVVYLVSFLLRYDLQLGQIPVALVVKTLPVLVVIRMAAIGFFHLFQGLWRYVGVEDLLQIIKASTAGSIAFIPLTWLIFGLDEFPAGVFGLDWAGNILALGGVRIVGPLFRKTVRSARPGGAEPKRLLIVGAGDAGVALCREAQGRPSLGLAPVGFVDDDPWKATSALLGIPVLGTRDDIPRVVADHTIDTVVVAIPSASREQMRGIAERCREARVPFRTLPSLPSILDGNASITTLQEVGIADLLGRDQVVLDREAMGTFLQGKRIVITGAAGSIGSELAKQIAVFQPELLVLIDRSENPLFYFEDEFQRTFPGQRYVAEVRDVCEYASIHDLLRTYQPHLVFHAAAHKHVPLMERSPGEAVRNNIFGTYNVARASQQSGVEKLVFISTDKAVNPTSVMGASKRAAELLLQSMNQSGPTRFIAVRFGNVLGSSASVVPIFKEQIARGGPVTVTHPDAERYFMSTSEAAQLVTQAGAIGTGGEIFVLDMGEPIRILDLARDLISLSGMEPDKDIEIVFTGLRPGEKLSEVLTLEAETLRPTSHPKLRVLLETPSPADVELRVNRVAAALPNLTPEQVKNELQGLIPEYSPALAPASPAAEDPS